MGDEKKVITRRDFLRTGSCLAAGSLMGLAMFETASAEDPSASRVVLVRDENVLDDRGQPIPAVLEKMLDRAVATVMKTNDPLSAWKQLIHEDDVVGIKSNAWHYLPTPQALEDILQKRLLDVGVDRENMAVDDRGILRNPVFSRSTALINVRPMRTHHWSGVGTLLKNYIMFTSRPYSYHGRACEKLGALWQLPEVKGKTRLNILVMLTPLFHGVGPHHFSRAHTWKYCGLIVSTDPVAADATGARIIQAKRDAFFGKPSPISPPPRHIAAADRLFGLGNSRPERIDLIQLGWKKNALIPSTA